MADFEINDETYQNKNHPEAKMHNLGRIDRGNEQQSMVWVQEFGKGRVFNTTLGHGQPAFDNPQFQRWSFAASTGRRSASRRTRNHGESMAIAALDTDPRFRQRLGFSQHGSLLQGFGLLRLCLGLGDRQSQRSESGRIAPPCLPLCPPVPPTNL